MENMLHEIAGTKTRMLRMWDELSKPICDVMSQQENSVFEIRTLIFWHQLLNKSMHFQWCYVFVTWHPTKRLGFLALFLCDICISKGENPRQQRNKLNPNLRRKTWPTNAIWCCLVLEIKKEIHRRFISTKRRFQMGPRLALYGPQLLLPLLFHLLRHPVNNG